MISRHECEMRKFFEYCTEECSDFEHCWHRRKKYGEGNGRPSK